MRYFKAAIVLLVLGPWSRPASAQVQPGATMIVKFHLLSSPIPTKNPHIDYNIDLNEDRFLMRLPPSYTPDKKYGLLVFISPDTDEQQPPRGWNEALDQNVH